MNAPRIVELISSHSGRVRPDTSLGEAAALMLQEKASSVIVVDAGRVLGIVTEGDILHAMREHRVIQLPVSTVMTSPVHSVPAHTDFREAYREAARLGIRHIVVTDENGLAVGVASESDFRRHLGPDFFRHLNSVDTLMDRLFPRMTADATVDAALIAIEAARASCVVVVAGRRPVGILTEHDVLRLFLSDAGSRPLAEVMTAPPITIGDDRSLAEAAEQMSQRRIRNLVVVDASGQAVGLLSEHMLMRPLELDLVDDVLSDRLLLTQSRDAAVLRTTRNERYQRALLDNFPFLVWLKDTESQFLAVNRRFAEAAGVANPDELIGKNDLDIWPDYLAERYRTDDAAVMATQRKKVVVEPLFIGQQHVLHETYKAPIIGEDGKLLGTVGFAQDITERTHAEEAMLLRNAGLSGLIRGEALVGVLELMTLSVEAEMPNWLCAIMLADETGKTLRYGAAPNLPEAYSAAIDGVAIGEGVGSCGTAAALRRRVIVEDVFTHPDWAPYRDLARETGFAACWSEPVLGPEGELLGTFAAYHKTPAVPSDEDLARLSQASQLVALVLVHHRNANKLEKSLETFRGIFDSISEALFIQAEDGSFLDVNPGAEQMFGYPRAMLVEQTQVMLGAPGLNDLLQVDQHLAAAMAGTPQRFEFWGRHADGNVFLVEVRLQKGDYFGRPALIASVLDITERQRADLRLRIEHDLAHALATGASRDEVLAIILQAALSFPELDCGGIYWQRPDGGYRLAVHAGLSAEFIAQVSEFAPDSAHTRLIKAGKMLCSCLPSCDNCNDAALLDSPMMQVEGLRCLAILPILINGEPLACLNLAGHRTSHISSATLQALDTVLGNFSQTLLRLAAQEEARRLQENLGGLFDTLADFIFILDLQGCIIYYNRAVAEGLGYGPQALLGQPVVAVHRENDRKIVTEIMADMLAGRCSSCALPLLHADGHLVMVETRVVNGYWNGQAALFGISQDISERLIAEERQKLAASVFDNAHEGIMITDPKGRIVEVNGTFSEVTGFSREEAIGQTAGLLKSGHHDAAFYEEMWQTIRADGFWRGEVWNRKKSGEIFVELLTISTVRDRNGDISHFVSIFSDITLIKEHQQRLEHLAHFDALTQLPNRMLLGDRMQLAMAQTERSGKSLGVCYLDLDGFKPVNDTYGHAIGDRLLVEVAQRLKACVRAGDTVSRLGGDEFVLLFSGLDNIHECDHAMARVIATLAHPFQIGSHVITISASIGVTLFPEDASDPDTLLRHADQAMYAAKQSGRNRYHLFDPENDRRARARREEVSRIRQALTDGEFVLYYQPKVNMRQGCVTGAEALIRWQHPEQGLLLPGEFLPAIEGTELAVEVGDWVICEAFRQLERLAELGLDISISINIASNHLLNPGFAARLSELLRQHPAVLPRRVELEILETAALEDMTLVAELFAECRKLGVSFALDDFGTGYSSLTYLRRLPADVLKIDQSFVRDMLDDPDDLAIVESVISLTQAFQRQVVAEGVETVEHGLVLLLLNCDTAQGFGIARPMSAELLPAWINSFFPDTLWSLATSFRWSREDMPMLIAEVDHGRWKKRLLAYLDDTTNTVPMPDGDHHDCRFGRWYYSPESTRYAAVDGFLALEKVHARIHEIGTELIRLRDSPDRAEVAQLRRDLEVASMELIECIQQLQAEILIAA